MAFVLTVSVLKGGSGKTSQVVNLAAGFARAGWRTLVVDLEPQGNASTHLGYVQDASRPTAADVLLPLRPADRAPATAAIYQIDSADFEGRLHLMPASEGLSQADHQLKSQPRWDDRLLKALAPLADLYDVIIVDTPPNAGTLLAIAAVAADGIIIPVPCNSPETYEAMERLEAELVTWRSDTGRPIPVLGIVAIMFQGNRNLDVDLLARLQKEQKALTFKTIIPDTTSVPASYKARRDVSAHAPSSPVAAAYTELVGEVARRIAARTAR